MKRSAFATWSLVGLASLALSSGAGAVQYSVRLTGTWTPAILDDPAAMPPFAHFTALVGATHSGAALWAPGGLASQGIENVAELGATLSLFQEVSARIAARSAGQWIQAPGLFDLTGSVATTFEATLAHSQVSLISMIAPSPDWFVGVSGVSLRANGAWVDGLSFELRPWDAGTEQGIGFSLANPDTIPREAIQPLFESPFLDRPVVARLTFERIGAVPEPASGPLFGLGLLALGWRRRRPRIPPESGRGAAAQRIAFA